MSLQLLGLVLNECHELQHRCGAGAAAQVVPSWTPGRTSGLGGSGSSGGERTPCVGLAAKITAVVQ